MNTNRRALYTGLAVLAAIVLVIVVLTQLDSPSATGNNHSFLTAQSPGRNTETGSADARPRVSDEGRRLVEQMSAVFEDVASRVNPSVIPIFSEQVQSVRSPFGGPPEDFGGPFGDDFFRRFFGDRPREQQRTIRSMGSGVIVTSDGYILTNNHVVAGASRLTIVFPDQRRHAARTVGTDPPTDLAVIKIDTSDLPAAQLGNSDDVRVGQWVIAVGNPFHLLHTVTAGIISAKGRSSVGLADYEDFIQTDASINPGNSGGALVNLDGDVVGINTAIASMTGANVGIGFAIPINMARQVMDKLIKDGKVARGFLGVTLQEVTPELASALNLKETRGVLVGDVTADGPAARAGIQRGDLIVAFEGKEVKASVELRNLVADSDPGRRARLTVVRDGREQTVTVMLGERPVEQAQHRPERNGEEEPAGRMLGMSVQTLTPALARQLGYENERGVVVTNVVAGSAAERAGIQRGDLVQEVNRERVASAEDFTRRTRGLRAGESVAMLVRRGETTFFVAVQLPEQARP